MNNNGKKMNVILDLDQTLISAQPLEEFDVNQHKEKISKFRSEDMDGYYLV
jgi:hypothetical protein